jgi:steroid delta-isomerase-like uncharacterized protein
MIKMQAMQVARCYFDAWNRRDAEAIVATFVKGGTYTDPSAGEGLVGEAIATYAKTMWSAFPDLVFDIRTVGHTEEGIVAAQWLMRGTNTGSFRGLPPTGRPVVLAGADFIQVEGDRIRSVQGYFDTRVVPEQLGLQVLIQPHAVGPFAFGTSTSVETGKKSKPGAFSITILQARSDEEIQKIKELSREIATEMLEMPGFMSWVGMTIGPRMRTVTAWETPEHRSTVDARRDSSIGNAEILRRGVGFWGNYRCLDSRAHQCYVGALYGLRKDDRFCKIGRHMRVR